MKRVFVLRCMAAREYERSIDFYEAKREGVGREFRAAIEEYFQGIADHPEWFRKIRGEVSRTVVPRRFSFVIHFPVEADRIVILSVFHTSREPEQLKRRR